MPRAWLGAAFAASAVFAGAVSLFSGNPLHRLWGVAAACAYAVAALIVMAWKSRAGVDVGLAAIVCGAILVPLIWMAWHGQGQPEVTVVARSANTLIRHGTPYKDPNVLAATTDPNDYNPYLPLMAGFGVPQAIAGHDALTDPRVWFGLVFFVVFAVALKVGGAKDALRWSVLMTASPIIAFELAVGGTDVPMVAFMCLGFAFLWRPGGEVFAGLALGIASSMKATAWPALAVAFALLFIRDGARAAGRFAAMALALVVVCVGPFAVTRPGALVKNTILFPLGLASVRSDAASPLPGHLIAQTGHLGHAVVVALLIGSGVAIAASLVIRPPRDVPAALWRLVLGLSLMFVLAPSTRFGYFIYPASLVIWLLVTTAGRRSDTKPAPPPLFPVAAQGLCRLCRLCCQVLELFLPRGVPPGEPRVDAGQRDDVGDGLGVVVPLLARRQVAQRLHVAGPVGELDQHGFARCVAEPAQVGLLDRLLILAVVRLRYGHPRHQAGHLDPEPRRDLLRRARRVLEHIVQHRRAQHVRIAYPRAPHQDLQRLKQVLDIGHPGGPQLRPVPGSRELDRLAHRVRRILRQQLPDLRLSHRPLMPSSENLHHSILPCHPVGPPQVSRAPKVGGCALDPGAPVSPQLAPKLAPSRLLTRLLGRPLGRLILLGHLILLRRLLVLSPLLALSRLLLPPRFSLCRVRRRPAASRAG